MTSAKTVENPELRKNLRIACEALLDKKAMDLKLLYFGDTSPLTDCFIIATGPPTLTPRPRATTWKKRSRSAKSSFFHATVFSQAVGWCWMQLISWCICSPRNNAKTTLWKTSGRMRRA